MSRRKFIQTTWTEEEDQYLVNKFIEYTSEGLVAKEAFAKISREMREQSISQDPKSESTCLNRWNNKLRNKNLAKFEEAKLKGKEIREKNLVTSIGDQFKIDYKESEAAVTIEEVEVEVEKPSLFTATGRVEPVEEVVQAVKTSKEETFNEVDVNSFLRDAQNFFGAFKKMQEEYASLQSKVSDLEQELKDVTEDRDKLAETNKMFANIMNEAQKIVKQ